MGGTEGRGVCLGLWRSLRGQHTAQQGRPHAWATQQKVARGVPTAGALADEWSFCLKIPTSSYLEPEGLPRTEGTADSQQSSSL